MKAFRYVCSAAALGLLFTAQAVAADAIDVRYGTWSKDGEAQYAATVKFKEIIEAKSNGRFKVSIYPDNQLGTPAEMLAQLALDTTQVMASGDPGIKEVEYLSLPYLVKGMANLEAIMASEAGDQWNAKLVNERKVRLLGFMPRSPRQISANKVINSMADLKGLKLRAPERDYYVQSLAALGAKPTPMAFSEVYTALQTGIVDGQENPIETIYAQKFYEVQKSIAIIDYIVKPAYVMIGEAFWQSLSEDDRKLFLEAQSESRALVEKLLPEQEGEIIAEMEKSGIVVTRPDKAEFIEATASVRKDLGTKVWGDELYGKIVEIGQKDF